MASGASPNSDPKSVFFGLFRKHWDAGTDTARFRRGRHPVKWTVKEFIDALDKYGAKITDDTIGNWLKRRHMPRREYWASILQVFFGGMESDPDRQAMHDALLRSANEAPRDPACQTPSPSWDYDPPSHLRPDGPRLSIETPPDGPPDRLTLVVSASLPEFYVKVPESADGPRFSADVRPARAEIVPDEQNMQPVQGTILGRDEERSGVTYDVTWRLDNPKGRNAPPLTEETLCDMRVLGDGPHAITLSLRCKDLDLDVDVREGPPDDTGKKIAVLRRLLQRMHCDPDAEHVVFATGGLRRGQKA